MEMYNLQVPDIDQEIDILYVPGLEQACIFSRSLV